ncbi:MAG: imidazole glycerol phosphate synthase subunit HisH [Roseovarius sp.]|nr:imidazole glycerol phosphate synthase subunit HisH [Roseovarius sp.]
MSTVIVDYESGNLHSAMKAFEKISSEHGHSEVVVTSDPEIVRKADRVVLPGDGAFRACKKELFDHRGLFQAIEEAVRQNGRPFLGICIGMQMLATQGLEHGITPGFNWIEGEVGPITPSEPGMKIPHMGWNNLVIKRRHPVLNGVKSGDHAYFVHSYEFNTGNPEHDIAHVEYGGDISAVVGCDNIVGTQFHPEKSQTTGLRIIANFLNWSP